MGRLRGLSTTVVAVTALGLLVAESAKPARGQAAVEVKLVKAGEGWQLLRGDQPYFIKGAGGSGSLERLRDAGGNSVRTWGADDLEPLLDEAQRLGLTVAVGIWLGQERQGFDYSNADQVAQQYERVRQTILRYRDHPAVLLWGLGNEVEGHEKGDNAAIWSALNNLAALAQKLDPKHPTMTVLAEIGGDRVKNVHRLCPDVDIVGINSYAGGPSIPKRYREAGGTKPYLLTEFGPPGTWEVGKTPWGGLLEPTSGEKAESYRRTYELAVTNQPLCLGSYAFTWGSKQEATATWFGMLLPDGSKLAAADAMTELWSGKPPANRCPRIVSLKLDGPDQLDPGTTVKATLEANDPEGDPLEVKWVLQADVAAYQLGGDSEQAPPAFPGAIAESDKRGATVRLPNDPGGYRLFVYVRDDHGGAATASVPLLVKGEVKPSAGLAARLPLIIYDEPGRPTPPYIPSGWMGNTQAIRMDESCKTTPHSGQACLRFDYTTPGEWGGVVWQSPADDWGDRPGGWDLTGAKRLVFWARGEKGGEVVTFQFGLLGRDKRYFDTAGAKLENLSLTTEWREYSMDLSGKDLSRLKTGFAWLVAGQGAPVTLYLDDIGFE